LQERQDTNWSSEEGTEQRLLHAALSVLAVVLLGAAMFSAPVVLVAFGPPVALLTSVLVLSIYSWWRNGGSGFGPLWLELVDLGVFFGNATAFVISAIALALP
jgi:hypothetical protein